MDFNRRLFLGALLGAAAVAADPERLLWVPGKKKIFIPPPLRAPTLYEAGYREGESVVFCGTQLFVLAGVDIDRIIGPLVGYPPSRPLRFLVE